MRISTDFFRKIIRFSLLFVLMSAFLLWHFSSRAESAETPEKPFELKNYDIRTDQTADAQIGRFSAAANKTAALISADREEMIRAEQNLRSKIPTLKIGYNEDLRIPEIIAPDSTQNADFLTAPNNGDRADILRSFLKQNSALIGLQDLQIDALKTTADYTNPDGNLSFVNFEQRINDIPVFRGEIKAGFTKRGAIFRIVNNLAPNLNYQTLSTDFGNVETAVSNAAKNIGFQTNEADTRRIETTSNDLKITFERGQFAAETTAEKTYFPIDSGVAISAWRVLLWTNRDAFYVIVDAQSGTLLWRKDITEYQTQPATYNVYGNTSSLIKTADSPTAFTPGCFTPSPCPEPSISNRQSFTLTGNAPGSEFNGLGWIPDGENRTIGNNAEAGIDRDGTQGIDPNGYAVGNPFRNFVYTYNPAPGNPPPGEEPLPPQPQTYPPSPFQQGSVTNAFYNANRWHDETYRLGFNESSRNFQTDNFGRGGAGNDSISVEVQDSSGTNSANFSTPADGTRPKLQLFVWTQPTPDRDGALDNQIAAHELTHGLSNRLHGNASGLTTNMARGMGEGWSDFYALALLSEPADNAFGIYPIGAYSIHQVNGFTSEYFYGLRRFPVAIKASVGTNNLPFNPLTFRYLNSDCDTRIGTATTNPNSAFPRNPIFSTSSGTQACDQVLNAGEIWSSILWEVRYELIQQYGVIEGNHRALQYITDGMKFAPLNPTMIQERDAIIAAASATDPNDVLAVRRGFAIRGLGLSASIQNVGTGNNNTVVTEAFDVTPNLEQSPTFTFTDSAPGGNGNGYAEPGESIILSIPLSNPSATTATNTTLQVVGGDGSPLNYGDIPNGQTVTRTAFYTIPRFGQCGVNAPFTFNVNSNLGAITFNRFLNIGIPFNLFTENFDTAIVPNLPNNWTTQQTGSGVNWTTTATTPDSAPNASFVPNPATAGGADLTSPGVNIVIFSNSSAVAEFRHSFNTESGSDGGVLEISIAGGAFQDIITASGSFLAGGYNGTLRGTGNPLVNRPGWTGNSNGYITTKILLPPSLSGQNVRFRWRIGHDQTGGGTGWWIDSVKIYDLACGKLPTSKVRADFDGDGETDISVYRPSEGNWYLNRSTVGFTVINWGLASDQLAPGDYDGDNKTDLAVFRPNADSNQPDFYILNSSNFTYSGYSWGLPNDVPVIEDYNGDGKDDIAVYRPSNHTFYVLKSGSGSVQTFSNIAFGTPTAGDFDGDGKGDFVTYSIDGWFISQSNVNYASVNFIRWGAAGDKPVAADYDGDGRDDLAVFRPSDRTWYIRNSNGGNSLVQFGLTNDIPAPGDYDGDRKDDIAVYRDGVWYINQSTAGIRITQFGLSGDLPIPNRYLP